MTRKAQSPFMEQTVSSNIFVSLWRMNDAPSLCDRSANIAISVVKDTFSNRHQTLTDEEERMEPSALITCRFLALACAENKTHKKQPPTGEMMIHANIPADDVVVRVAHTFYLC